MLFRSDGLKTGQGTEHQEDPESFDGKFIVQAVFGEMCIRDRYLAEHKRLHTCWAVKEVRKAQGARFDFLAESNILKNLDHRMLPRIVDIFEDESAVYIVEDYVKGITLQAFLDRETRVEETRGVQWFLDLCDVLDYLHRQAPHPIIYRDIKPANIMLQPDGMLKLIDFGIARTYKQESGGDTACIGTKEIGRAHV